MPNPSRREPYRFFPPHPKHAGAPVDDGRKPFTPMINAGAPDFRREQAAFEARCRIMKDDYRKACAETSIKPFNLSQTREKKATKQQQQRRDDDDDNYQSSDDEWEQSTTHPSSLPSSQRDKKEKKKIPAKKIRNFGAISRIEWEDGSVFEGTLADAEDVKREAATLSIAKGGGGRTQEEKDREWFDDDDEEEEEEEYSNHNDLERHERRKWRRKNIRIIEGEPFGPGKWWHPNGNSYEGEWRNGLFEGQGCYIWKARGESFTGTFHQGVAWGKGRYIFGNGDEYSGDFERGIMHGSGTWKYAATGDVYTGEFQDGVACGRGRFEALNPATVGGAFVYCGEYFNDSPHGRGRKDWVDGRWYEGEWNKGVQQGKGEYGDLGGNRLRCEWDGGKPQGYGVLHFANGDVYRGQWGEGGYMHGKGVYVFAKGDSVDCEWRQGRPYGIGVYSSSSAASAEGRTKKVLVTQVFASGQQVTVDLERGLCNALSRGFAVPDAPKGLIMPTYESNRRRFEEEEEERRRRSSSNNNKMTQGRPRTAMASRSGEDAFSSSKREGGGGGGRRSRKVENEDEFSSSSASESEEDEETFWEADAKRGERRRYEADSRRPAAWRPGGKAPPPAHSKPKFVNPNEGRFRSLVSKVERDEERAKIDAQRKGVLDKDTAVWIFEMQQLSSNFLAQTGNIDDKFKVRSRLEVAVAAKEKKKERGVGLRPQSAPLTRKNNNNKSSNNNRMNYRDDESEEDDGDAVWA